MMTDLEGIVDALIDGGAAPEDVELRRGRLENFRLEGRHILFDLRRHWPVSIGSGQMGARVAHVLILQTYSADREQQHIDVVAEEAVGVAEPEWGLFIGTGPEDLVAALRGEVVRLESEDAVAAWARERGAGALEVDRELWTSRPRLPEDTTLGDSFMPAWERFGEEYSERWQDALVDAALQTWEWSREDD